MLDLGTKLTGIFHHLRVVVAAWAGRREVIPFVPPTQPVPAPWDRDAWSALRRAEAAQFQLVWLWLGRCAERLDRLVTRWNAGTLRVPRPPRARPPRPRPLLASQPRAAMRLPPGFG